MKSPIGLLVLVSTFLCCNNEKIKSNIESTKSLAYVETILPLENVRLIVTSDGHSNIIKRVIDAVSDETIQLQKGNYLQFGPSSLDSPYVR